jgi:hypothetical protein
MIRFKLKSSSAHFNKQKENMTEDKELDEFLSKVKIGWQTLGGREIYISREEWEDFFNWNIRYQKDMVISDEDRKVIFGEIE